MMEETAVGKCIAALEACLLAVDEARAALNAPSEDSAEPDRPALWSVVAYGVFDVSGKLIEDFQTVENAKVAKGLCDLQHASDGPYRVVPLYAGEE